MTSGAGVVAGTRAHDRPVERPPLGDLLDALVQGWCLAGVVPLVLDAAERDPLASAGRCPGDLVRALVDVPGAFWSRYPGLFARYQTVLRASAAARRALPLEQRLQFWTALADRHDTTPSR